MIDESALLEEMGIFRLRTVSVTLELIRELPYPEKDYVLGWYRDWQKRTRIEDRKQVAIERTISYNLRNRWRRLTTRHLSGVIQYVCYIDHYGELQEKFWSNGHYSCYGKKKVRI